MTDSQGQTVSLSDYRGKVVLVDFWSPGWTPWQRDLEYQRSLYRRYQPVGLEVLGVALGSRLPRGIMRRAPSCRGGRSTASEP